MATQEKKSDEKAKRASDVVLEHAGEVVITPLPTAARAPEGKQIHPRRPLPLVPTKRDTEADQPTKNQNSNSDEA
jgi:hypothetical protein